jgi:hypothetical protein
MSAKNRIVVMTNTVRFVAASLVMFWLFTKVVSQPEPAWINFWSLFFSVVLVCIILNRVMRWIHNRFFR